MASSIETRLGGIQQLEAAARALELALELAATDPTALEGALVLIDNLQPSQQEPLISIVEAAFRASLRRIDSLEQQR